MNKARRTSLAKLVEQIQGISSGIEVLRDEEQEYLDLLTIFGLQGGDKTTASEGAIDEMDSALNALGDAESNIESAQK
jgi:hypothetical protein